MPDASTLTQLPWNPRVGYLACDLVWQGDYLDHAPRNALRAMSRKLGDRGLAMKTGVECEFFYWTRRRAPWRTVWKSTRECRQLEI